MGQNLLSERRQPEVVTTTVAKRKGEAARPGAGDGCVREHEIQPLPKDAQQRALAARAESFSALPGEVSSMRVLEKSAGAVVAKKPGKLGRAKG